MKDWVPIEEQLGRGDIPGELGYRAGVQEFCRRATVGDESELFGICSRLFKD